MFVTMYPYPLLFAHSLYCIAREDAIGPELYLQRMPLVVNYSTEDAIGYAPPEKGGAGLAEGILNIHRWRGR